MKTDTIAAIATGMSNSGIGIVRISGDDALQVISRIYRNKKGEPKNLSQVKSHTIHYGYIYDGEERLDEVLVMIMKGPNSYTAEDTVEMRLPRRCLYCKEDLRDSDPKWGKDGRAWRIYKTCFLKWTY